MSDSYQHFLRKAREAKRGGIVAWSVMSTGEKVAVALVLNRADWLKGFGYTIPEAIERTGEWLQYLSRVERELWEEERPVPHIDSDRRRGPSDWDRECQESARLNRGR